jgi:hypothetical protein
MTIPLDVLVEAVQALGAAQKDSAVAYETRLFAARMAGALGYYVSQILAGQKVEVAVPETSEPNA